MRGMILAAGRGERMGALTAELPKPLLKLAGRYLIEYPLLAFAQAGIREIVINVSYHAEKIQQALGDGAQYGVKITYSYEAERLETGGGIFQALPLLGTEPFIVLSSDIISEYPLQNLPQQPEGLAHLVMVKNPVYHPRGDFGLRGAKLDMKAQPSLTFSNIGVYRPELFADCKPGHFRLGKLLIEGILQDRLSGELYTGMWRNIGTPQELAALESEWRAREESNLRPLASETNTLSS